MSAIPPIVHRSAAIKQEAVTLVLEKYPGWAKSALQGITYWIGHRRCVYRGYQFIIEVKRAIAPKSQINGDLRRMAAVRHEHSGVRTFMFVIAEAQRPSRFVNEEGISIRRAHAIRDSKGVYRVRRTWKAAHALSTIEKAQYACLLEVYGW